MGRRAPGTRRAPRWPWAQRARRRLLRGAGPARTDGPIRRRGGVRTRIARVHHTGPHDAARRRTGRHRDAAGHRSPAGRGGRAHPRRTRAARSRPRWSRWTRRTASPRDGRRPRLRPPAASIAPSTHAAAGSAFKPFVYAAALERAFRRPRVDQLDHPVATLQGPWVPDDGRAATRRRFDDARALRRRATVPRCGCSTASGSDGGPLCAAPRYGACPGAIARARLGRGHAAVDDVGLHGVCEPGWWPSRRSSAASTTESGRVTSSYVVSRAEERALAEATAFILTRHVADVINAGTAWQACARWLHAARRGQDRHDQRLSQGRVVHRLYAAPGDRCVDGFDRPRDDLPNGYAGELAVPLWGRFMQAATAGDRPGWLQPPPGLEWGPGLRRVRLVGPVKPPPRACGRRGRRVPARRARRLSPRRNQAPSILRTASRGNVLQRAGTRRGICTGARACLRAGAGTAGRTRPACLRQRPHAARSPPAHRPGSGVSGRLFGRK